MVINTNTAASSGARLLSESSAMLAKSLNRLSSGSKIGSPDDDAAGSAVSLRFDAQQNRVQAANTNVTNAVSFSQTQDGFLGKVAKALDRMSELSVLSQDVTKTDTDRGLYNAEFQKLGSYINDLATKDFNGVSLFSSTALNVTTDSDANTVSMTGINLGAASYTNATGAAVDTSAHAATAEGLTASGKCNHAWRPSEVGRLLHRPAYSVIPHERPSSIAVSSPKRSRARAM